MAIPDDFAEELDVLVRSGFEDRDRMLEILCEELYEPEDVDPDEAAVLLDAAIAKHDAAKKTWPNITDCDRLDAAFEAMQKRGIITLQNAGMTQSDGHSDFLDALESHPAPKEVIGYCFYQGQDLARAVQGNGLFLAFGPVDADDEEELGPPVGAIVVEELTRAGFQTSWNGTFKQRIHIPKLDWKRR